MAENKPSVRIIILNYKGAQLLPQCLPSIVQASKSSRYPCEITVLNNPSDVEDDGIPYVEKEFPEVTVYQAKENRILCSFNDYLPLIQEDIAVLMNNDIRVDEGFVDPLIEPFVSEENTFLVAPKTMNFDGAMVEAGASRSGIKFGFFWCDARYKGYEKNVDTPSETASTGFGAFSCEKFLELGGYDDLFYPGIMEDVDLSYRAQQKGYQCYYAPESIVYHMGQVSFKNEFGKEGTSAIAHRNNFLFMWKHFTTPFLKLSYYLFLPLRLAYAKLKGNTSLLEGYRLAVEFKKNRSVEK